MGGENIEGERPKIVAVIPALDEQQAVGGVVRGLIERGITDVVVVDNGSRDDTAAVASKCGAMVVAEPDRGYGSACLTGIKEASKLNPEAILFLDADGADDLNRLDEIVRPIEDGRADFVVGSRMLGGMEKGAMAPLARLGNRLAIFLIRLIFKHKYTDLGPFRAIRLQALESLGMTDKDYGWTVEMQIKAVKNNLRIVEVPVGYRPRQGKSKVSGTLRGTLGAGFKIIYTILRLAW